MGMRELARREPQPAASSQRLRLDGVANPHAEPGSVSHVSAQDLGLVSERDDDLLDAVVGEPVELALDDRPATHLDHGHGRSSVLGRSRSPLPPATMTACRTERKSLG